MTSASESVSGTRLLIALGLWIVGAFLAGSGTLALAHGSAGAAPIIVAEVYIILIGALVAVIRPTQALGLTRTRSVDVALAAAACVIAYAIAAFIQSVLLPWSWSSTVDILRAMGSDNGRLASSSASITAVILVRACLLAPLAEEMLFRGVLFAWLRRRLSSGAVVLLTAAAHTAIHGLPAVMPLVFVMGLGFGWIRERSGSVTAVIIVHALHNAAMVVFAYQSAGWTAHLPAWSGQ